MDFINAIYELKQELKKIDAAIGTIESLIGGGDVAAPQRRGRKNMSMEERRIVSQRMTKYWANRRRKQHREAATS